MLEIIQQIYNMVKKMREEMDGDVRLNITPQPNNINDDDEG